MRNHRDMPNESGGDHVKHDVSPGASENKPKVRKPFMLGTITASDLAAKHFPPITYVVPNYVVQGLTVLAGRPKAGKSWLALDIAVGVAIGGRVFGSIKVDQGDTLYLALEDNQRRLQNRLNKLLPSTQKPQRLHLATECPRLNAGGVEAIDAWCAKVPKARLIVVDYWVRSVLSAAPMNRSTTLTTDHWSRLRPWQTVVSLQ
jgi:hypothetical protein